MNKDSHQTSDNNRNNDNNDNNSSGALKQARVDGAEWLRDPLCSSFLRLPIAVISALPQCRDHPHGMYVCMYMCKYVFVKIYAYTSVYGCSCALIHCFCAAKRFVCFRIASDSSHSNSCSCGIEEDMARQHTTVGYGLV